MQVPSEWSGYESHEAIGLHVWSVFQPATETIRFQWLTISLGLKLLYIFFHAYCILGSGYFTECSTNDLSFQWLTISLGLKLLYIFFHAYCILGSGYFTECSTCEPRMA